MSKGKHALDNVQFESKAYGSKTPKQELSELIARGAVRV